MINVIVTAPRGNMGKLIVKEAMKNNRLHIAGAIGPFGRDYIGKDVGEVAGLQKKTETQVFDNIYDIIDKSDVIIDFSTVELSMEMLEAAVKHKKAFICGTTGFTKEQEDLLKNAASEIPILKAANTSFVVNVMNRLLSMAASSLNGIADIEIIDMHSSTKKDAPSGTAKEMAHIMAEATGNPDLVAFHSVRAGDIPSSHMVLFGCMGERLEISHHAYNWDCYAAGACKTIEFLYGKEPGYYLMEDVVNEKRGVL